MCKEATADYLKAEKRAEEMDLKKKCKKTYDEVYRIYRTNIKKNQEDRTYSAENGDETGVIIMPEIKGPSMTEINLKTGEILRRTEFHGEDDSPIAEKIVDMKDPNKTFTYTEDSLDDIVRIDYKEPGVPLAQRKASEIFGFDDIGLISYVSSSKPDLACERKKKNFWEPSDEDEMILSETDYFKVTASVDGTPRTVKPERHNLDEYIYKKDYSVFVREDIADMWVHTQEISPRAEVHGAKKAAKAKIKDSVAEIDTKKMSDSEIEACANQDISAIINSPKGSARARLDYMTDKIPAVAEKPFGNNAKILERVDKHFEQNTDLNQADYSEEEAGDYGSKVYGAIIYSEDKHKQKSAFRKFARVLHSDASKSKFYDAVLKYANEQRLKAEETTA